MIPETGLFALILALFVAVYQAVIPLIGAARGDRAWMDVAGPAAMAQCILVAIAFLSLTWCYITSDFSVMNVAQNSHTDKPLFYKISGVWGNHEGSMLLWELILTVYGMSVAVFGGNLPPTLRARALSVQSMISAGFLLFILFTSNPFARLDPAPLNGSGLNPLLQDPGLAFHPPILYLGYVGFSMAFSFALAALIEGRVDAAWARWVRPWTLAAWVFLTLGITGGSWWAYYTLGWGGWWYWDPTENASFMPWLAGTALLHSSVVVEKRDTMKAWTILLAIITFSLALMGTFLVRSGVLTSVHSFASDPARGVFILALLVLITGGSLALFGLRAPTLKPGGLFSPISREGSLLLNNAFLSAAAATVFLGTLYPLFADALNLGKVSVGPPFFNAMFIPLMIPLLILVPVGSLLAWKRGDLSLALRKLKWAFIAVALVFVWVLVIKFGSANFLWSAAGMGLAAWLFVGMLVEWAGRVHLFKATPKESLRAALKLPRSAYGMTLAHMGLAFLIVGIVGSSLWRTEKIQVMRPGETIDVAGYAVTLKEVEDGLRGPNYTYSRATFEARKGDRLIAQMHPEKRVYIAPPQPTTKAALRSTLLGDLYVVLADPDEKGGYVTRLYYDPLVIWIFGGAGFMALGGVVSLTDRRHRIGAPVRKKNRSGAGAAAGVA